MTTIISYKAFRVVNSFVTKAKTKQTVDSKVPSPIVGVNNRTRRNVILDNLEKGLLRAVFDDYQKDTALGGLLHPANDPDTFHTMATMVLALAKFRLVDLDNNTFTTDLLVYEANKYTYLT